MRERSQRRIVRTVAALAFVAAACGGSDEATTDTQADVQGTESVNTQSEAAADGCPPEGGADTQTREFSGPPPFCLDPAATYTATLSTNVGVLTLNLDQTIAPNAVNNFVFLARNQYFDDTVCHRIIQEFVAQCGDPTATGTGGPGYVFGDELPPAGAYSVGSLAMANAGPNTNGSQFFIITGANGAALDPDYSLFGQVAESDLDVVAEMNALGSLDSSGIPSSELQIFDVTITAG